MGSWLQQMTAVHKDNFFAAEKGLSIAQFRSSEQGGK